MLGRSFLGLLVSEVVDFIVFVKIGLISLELTSSGESSHLASAI